MKKMMFLLMFAILLVGTVYADTTYMYERQLTTDSQYFAPNGVNIRFQSFTIGTTGLNETQNITKIGLYLKKAGSPTANFNIMLKTVNASGHPNGSILALANYTASDISATEGWVNITLSNNYTQFFKGTRGAIITSCPACDGTNNIQVFVNGSGDTYAGGQKWASTDAGASWTAQSDDYTFIVYGLNGTIIAGTPDEFPTINQNSPADALNTTTTTQTFNCSASDDVNISNMSLYIDGKLNYTINFSSPTAELIKAVNFSYAFYNWSCLVIDSNGQINYTANRTFEISPLQDYKPSIFLNSPNNSYNTTGTVNFNCSATDGFGVRNISFYLDDILNYTMNFSGLTSAQINRTLSLSVGSHNWSCRAYDTAQQVNASSTRNLTIYSIPATPTPTPVTDTDLYKLSASVGSGIGVFLGFIGTPLLLFILILVVVAMIISIFYAIVTAIKHRR